MDNQQTEFKENILALICEGAQKYKTIFLDYEYEISSKAFSNEKSYIISATKSNFLHLTGVNTKLSAEQFFNKAFDKSLRVNDFDFCKKCQNKTMVKGSVRRKVGFLPFLENIFSAETLAEENFVKGRVVCMLAVSENAFTLGFIATPTKCRPKTLLKGNLLKNPCKIDSIRRRRKGGQDFEDFISGNCSDTFDD
ncbi:MAG: hypothetical protein K2N58_01680 [Treponemataceae bacterium]|nr:hypothetical protein [Treponemataceae bacterium]